MKPREIKARIDGMNSTVKITRAMQMLATSKLSSAQNLYGAACAYCRAVEDLTGELSISCFGAKTTQDSRRGIIIIAADRGLCGDYNNLVIQTAADVLKDGAAKCYTVGAKATAVTDNIPTARFEWRDEVYALAEELADAVISDFDAEEVTSVTAVYTDSKSPLAACVLAEEILPLKSGLDCGEDIIRELSDDGRGLGRLSVTAHLYKLLTSSFLSENFKRMSAMQTATQNGEKMLAELNVAYQQKRQGDITAELTDAATSARSKKL